VRRPPRGWTGALAGLAGLGCLAWLAAGAWTLTAQDAEAPADPAARIAKLEARAKATPRPDLYFELARLRLAQGDDVTALHDLARAARLAPQGDYVQTYFLTVLDHERYRGRIELLESLAKELPDYPPLLERLGLLYQGKGRDAEAEKALKTWVRVRPDDPGAHAGLAEFYRAVDRPKDAIPRLEKVRGLSGENTYALRRLGVLYRETGDLDASAARLEKAIAEAEGVRAAAAGTVKGLKPGEKEEDLAALVELGHTRLAQERPADAAAAFARAVRLDPGSPAYRLFLARAEEAKGDPKAARSAYEKAVELDKFSLDAQLGLGRLLLGQGDPKAALPHLKEASSRNDRDPELHFLVGQTALEAGDLKAAEYEHAKLKQIRSTTLARKLHELLEAHGAH
jgi:tetratricopeptide (TPR) repeat protein